MSPLRTFASQGFHTTLKNYAAETKHPISFALVKAGMMGMDGGCQPWCDPGCSQVM